MRSYDGRPIKIEGNGLHSLNRGATDVFAQASVLDLYDPDRGRGVIRNVDGKRVVVGWEEFAEYAAKHLVGDGKGFCVLSEASGSPSVAAMRQRLAAKMPGMKWYEYEAISGDNVREGLRMAYGQPLRAVLELEKAAVIVALDVELFCNGDPTTIEYVRDFAAGRRLHKAEGQQSQAKMNRLWVVEPSFTNTGAAADHRRAVAAGAIPLFVAELAAALGAGAEAGRTSGVEKEFTERLAADLKANAGACVLTAGAGQPAAIHAMVAVLNAKLSAAGKTVVYYADPEPGRVPHTSAIAMLAGEMKAGAVKELLIIGGNPVYDAPADLGFAVALAKLPNSMHLSTHDDETSQACQWQLPRANYLEAWGDARTFDGTVSVAQPMIAPLFEGKSTIELLALILGQTPESEPAADGYGIVRRTVAGLRAGAGRGVE